MSILQIGKVIFRQCLKRIAYDATQLVGEDKDWPLTFYLRAPEFLVYARNRRTVYDFIVDKVFSLMGDPARWGQELRQELEAQDRNGKLLLLVDDLDYLPEPDQTEVMLQLAFSPTVVCATLPWQAERIARLLQQPAGRRPDLGEYWLADLDAGQQRHILVNLVQGYSLQFDLDLGFRSLAEVPDLARLPMGVMAVHSQVSAHTSDRARVTQRALEEHFVRAGLERPEFGGNWSDLDATGRTVIHAAANVGYLLNRAASLTSEQQESLDWAITRTEFEGTAETGAGCKWSLLAPTRLLAPVRERGEGEMLRFANRDILCYCLAWASRHAYLNLNPSLTQLQNQMGELARQIKSYEDALWENDAAWRL